MEVVAGANEALTLFSSIHELCCSVKQRIDNFRGNRQQLDMLKNELSYAEKKVIICRRTLDTYCEGIATETLEFEVVDLQGILDKMRCVEESVQELEKKLPRRRRFLREVGRANRIAEDISEQIRVVRDVSSLLNNMNDKLKMIGQQNDVFTPNFSSIPNVRVPVYLDFSTGDTMEGEVKATLVENVKRGPRGTQNVPAHVTAVVSVSGMGGVGKTIALIGLGRDAEVQEMFARGGIYFLGVGKDATAAKLVGSLKGIVSISGGERRSEKIDNNGSLESAVRTTSSWFAGRRALFILDDLWQTSSSHIGYFKELIGLLDESPESHILISTRSNMIACESGTRIEFQPREHTGYESRRMFLASAKLDESYVLESGCEELVEQVLELCGGVPLMISIAGAQIRRRRGTPIASLKRFLRSLRRESILLLEEQPAHYSSCFNQAVEANLYAIAGALQTSATFKKHWNEHRRCNATMPVTTTVDFVIDSFQRLCVLPRSAQVSEDIIYGIWKSTHASKKIAWNILNSLVGFHLLLEFEDSEGNVKYGLHDIILDYCQLASQFGQNAKHELYHWEFLNHAWKLLHQELPCSSSTECKWDDCEGVLRAFWLPKACQRSRPWWKVLSSSEELPEMEAYLLQNLFRHLKESGRLAEAVGLLSHMGWTKLRVMHGGINALNADFSLITEAIREYPGKEEDRMACNEALLGITNICSMVGRSWAVILKKSGCLPTHAYGYLLDDENELPLVERYLQSVTDIVTGPWLKPRSAFWRRLDSSFNQRPFRTDEHAVGIAIGSESAIAATRNTVFWIDIETMTATREMVIRNDEESCSRICAMCLCELEGILVLGFSSGELELRNERNGNMLREIPAAHEGRVTSVAISADGRTLVSGSWDKTVRCWDVESATRIGEPFRGHEHSVESVGISADGRTVVSGSLDKTVRCWDVESKRPVGAPFHGHDDSVSSVAISSDGRTVVSGSWDKTLRCWDVFSGTLICEPFRGHGGFVRSVAITADGRRVMSGSIDRTVRLWDVESGTLVGEPFCGHEHSVESVAISTDGRRLVSGSYDKTVRCWNGRSRTIVKSFHRNVQSVYSVAISSDSRRVVSGSLDKTIRLWDADTGKLIGEPFHGHDDSVYSVAISADGRTVVSGSLDRTVRLWDADTGKQIIEPFEDMWTRYTVWQSARMDVGWSLVPGIRRSGCGTHVAEN